MDNKKNKFPKYEEYEDILAKDSKEKSIKWSCNDSSEEKETECKCCHKEAKESSKNSEIETFVWKVEGEPIKKCTVEVEFASSDEDEECECSCGHCACEDEPEEDDKGFTWNDLETYAQNPKEFPEDEEDLVSKEESIESCECGDSCKCEEPCKCESSCGCEETSKLEDTCGCDEACNCEDAHKCNCSEVKESKESTSSIDELSNRHVCEVNHTEESLSECKDTVCSTKDNSDSNSNENWTVDKDYIPFTYDDRSPVFDNVKGEEEDFSFVESNDKSERPFHDPEFYEARDFEESESCCGHCDGSCKKEESIESEEQAFIEIISNELEAEDNVEVISDEPAIENNDEVDNEEDFTIIEPEDNNETSNEDDFAIIQAEENDGIDEEDFIITEFEDEEDGVDTYVVKELDDDFAEAEDIIKEFMELNNKDACEGCTCSDEDVPPLSDLLQDLDILNEKPNSPFTDEELKIIEELSKPEVKAEREMRAKEFQDNLIKYTTELSSPKVESEEPKIDVIEANPEIVEKTEEKIESVLDKNSSLDAIKTKIETLEASVKDYEKVHLYSQSELIEKLCQIKNATDEEADILLDSATKKIEFLNDVISRAKNKYENYDCDFLYNMINKIEDAVKIFKTNNNK